jgi:hypothetical protein
MNATDTSAALADPIQLIGMSYYFDPATVERAKAHGLNVFQFYGLGRGGVLGDVDYDTVFEAFTFFSPSAMNMLWTKSREHADPVETANHHILAAYAYADATFGAVPLDVLEKFAAAVIKVANAVPSGHHLLFDGYKNFSVPSNPVHAAYLGAILMRELRGGVHIDAVREAGLSPVDAAYLQNSMIYKMHGYSDEEAPEVTEELQAKKQKAEELTTAGMAAFLSVLSDEELDDLHRGTVAMNEAIANPVSVAQ